MKMHEKTFHLAMAQMLVEGGAPQANLERAVQMVAKAAERDCAFVVLPECLDLGWTHPSARDLAQPIPGEHSDKLSFAAQEASVYVAAGLTERCGGRIYSAAVLISPEGEILLKYRKINILDIAQDLYATGDSLAVAETDYGKVGVNICADNFSNSLVLAHSLARMGAQLILSPCAWAMPADHDNTREPYGRIWKDAYSSLATLYNITVVGVSNVGRITGGPWEGRKCIGCSLAVGPGGHIIAQLPYGVNAEELSVIETEIVEPKCTGPSIAEMLKVKGYDGP